MRYAQFVGCILPITAPGRSTRSRRTLELMRSDASLLDHSVQRVCAITLHRCSFADICDILVPADSPFFPGEAGLSQSRAKAVAKLSTRGCTARQAPTWVRLNLHRCKDWE